MLQKIIIDRHDEKLIRQSIRSLSNSENVVIIKKGAQMLEKSEWISFIENGCGLKPDRRHFDPNWAMHDAARNAKQHGLLDAEAATANETSTEEQIRGADWWEISYQPDREIAYAFSKTPQPLHTDNAWFADPAEVNFFIMAKQAISGGAQTIYPLSRLIEDLSNDDPNLLDDLSTIPVVIRKGDNDFANHTTIIRRGERPQIFWNYYRTIKTEKAVADLCDQFFKYLGSKIGTASVDTVYLNTGDCLSFNDVHMLHGRQAFEASMPRERILLHSMWKI